ncbi:DUF3102 domain-containing protein [Chamaesiphon sp. VAR_69_metabat_338]|uniref:DUF3102 domain-containing protein n=1 Tax=Chamaesiphon sp. VAR_69_metabat_338 TaxID=2964704 RepID=UPI00286E73FE|nr:DUF3102 domain-containing protein [Chamaesiphon sp. VAR_69_metabat_338]
MRHVNQNTHQNAEFEYEALKTEQRTSIEKLTLEIKDSIHHTVATMWQIGKNLVEVRRQLGMRQFTQWLKTEFDWSRRTAYNFMNVYEAVPDSIRANFARIDISISALYLLAAPSTQSEIRCDFFDRAVAGERIIYSVVQRAICEAKSNSRDIERSRCSEELNAATDFGEQTLLAKQQRADAETNTSENSDLRISLVQPANVQSGSDDAIDIDAEIETEEPSFISPAWNSIQKEFSLFWGDTMSPRFQDRLPDNAFVLAIPSIQWHHDWLANDDRGCIAIPRSQLEYQLVEQFLSALAENDRALILPWIPSWKTIELALDLDLRIYAGDPDLVRCEQMVINLGFDPQQVDRIRW